jgi:hypothetical protein
MKPENEISFERQLKTRTEIETKTQIFGRRLRRSSETEQQTQIQTGDITKNMPAA